METLADDIRAGQIASRLTSLLALEEAWTVGLGRNRAEEREGMIILADQLLGSIAALEDEVPFVVALTREVGGERLEACLADPRAPKEAVLAVRAQVDSLGSAEALMNDRVGQLGSALASQREAIESHRARIRAGEPPPIGGGDTLAYCIAAAVTMAMAPRTLIPALVVMHYTCPPSGPIEGPFIEGSTWRQ